MSAIHTKKMLILDILEVLKQHTDAEHPMTQKEIIAALDLEYGLSVDRKAVKRNLDDLIDAGYPIRCGSETARTFVNPETGETEENIMASDFYYEHDFSDGELRLLIDSLLFSKHIPYSQCKQLVEKLEGLSNDKFRYRVRHIRNMPENQPENKQLFYTIEILDEAISKHKQVKITYNGYGTDKKLHPHLNNQGKPRRLVLNPYQIVATNGRYYLICNADRFDDGRTINGTKQDVGAILPVNAYEYGLEVPGQIKASFNRPRGGTAERIYDDSIIEFSKLAFNLKSQTETYVINKHIGGNLLNNLPDFELEELIISYIQVKYDFYLLSNSIASKSTTVNIECEFISRNLEKADHAVVQVKGPKAGKLDAQEFAPFFKKKGYKVFLYAPEIINHEKYDNCIVISEEDILKFFYEYKNNLPESITKWENILG